LARAWYAAGRIDYVNPRLGTFEGWCQVVGNILSHVGYEDFLGNQSDVYDHSDADGGQWEAFFEAWAWCFGDNAVTAAEVIRQMGVGQNLRDAIPDWLADYYQREPGKFRLLLGQALARQRNAQYGPWRLERTGQNRQKVALWRVVKVSTAGEVAA
jgi:hypothetical protein